MTGVLAAAYLTLLNQGNRQAGVPNRPILILNSVEVRVLDRNSSAAVFFTPFSSEITPWYSYKTIAWYQPYGEGDAVMSPLPNQIHLADGSYKQFGVTVPLPVAVFQQSKPYQGRETPKRIKFFQLTLVTRDHPLNQPMNTPLKWVKESFPGVPDQVRAAADKINYTPGSERMSLRSFASQRGDSLVANFLVAVSFANKGRPAFVINGSQVPKEGSEDPDALTVYGDSRGAWAVNGSQLLRGGAAAPPPNFMCTGICYSVRFHYEIPDFFDGAKSPGKISAVESFRHGMSVAAFKCNYSTTSMTYSHAQGAEFDAKAMQVPKEYLMFQGSGTPQPSQLKSETPTPSPGQAHQAASTGPLPA